MSGNPFSTFWHLMVRFGCNKWFWGHFQDFDKNFLDSNHVLKVYFNPSRKNPDFGFLPLPSEPVWLKTPYLNKIHLKENKENLVKNFCSWVDSEFVKTCDELVIRKEKIHCTGMGSYKSSRATRGLVRTYWSRKGQKGHQKYCSAIAHKYKWRHCQKVRDHNV